jgi:hypothetical protein
MQIDNGYDRAYSSIKALYVNASDKAYCDKRWGVWNEYGVIAIVYADCEQDALDIIVDDSTKLDSCQVANTRENREYHARLGNDGMLYDLDYIGMQQI